MEIAEALILSPHTPGRVREVPAATRQDGTGCSSSGFQTTAWECSWNHMILKSASKTLKLYDFHIYDHSRKVLPVSMMIIPITGPGPNSVPMALSTYSASTHEVIVPSPSTVNLGVVAHAYNPSTWELQAGGLETQGQH